jgi:hypothetical protein
VETKPENKNTKQHTFRAQPALWDAYKEYANGDDGRPESASEGIRLHMIETLSAVGLFHPSMLERPAE